MTTEPPDGGWGWVVVLGSFVSNMLVAALYFAYGVFTQSWMSEFNASSGMVSLVGCTASAFISGSAPLASFIINKWGCRVAHMIGAFLVTSGVLLCSLATSLPQVFVFYGLLGGTGLGLCYIPSVIGVSQYFKKRRGIAIGLSSSGIGTGSFVFPILLDALQVRYTWRGAMLILSGIVAHTTACAAVIFPLKRPTKPAKKAQVGCLRNPETLLRWRRKPATPHTISTNQREDCELEVCPEPLMHEEDKTSMTSSTCEECGEKLALEPPQREESFAVQSRQIFCNPLFYVMVVNNVTMFVSMMLVFALTPLRATTELGFTSEQGAWFVSVMGLATLIGRISWGALSNRLHSPIAMFITLRIVASLLTLLSPLATSFVLQMTYCALVGLAYGLWSLYPIVVARLFGDRSLNAALGYLEVFDGLGSFLGPTFGGLIYDVTKSFHIPFLFSGFVMAIGTCILCIGYKVFKRKRFPAS